MPKAALEKSYGCFRVWRMCSRSLGQETSNMNDLKGSSSRDDHRARCNGGHENKKPPSLELAKEAKTLEQAPEFRETI